MAHNQDQMEIKHLVQQMAISQWSSSSCKICPWGHSSLLDVSGLNLEKDPEQNLPALLPIYMDRKPGEEGNGTGLLEKPGHP